jgi:hypothetical protein
MPKPIHWTTQMDIQLAILAKVHSDRVIAIHMGLHQEAVRHRRGKLKIRPAKQNSAPRPRRFIPERSISFPTFEDQPLELQRPDPTPGDPKTWWRRLVINNRHSLWGSSMAQMVR